MPNNLSVLYKHIIQVENEKVGGGHKHTIAPPPPNQKSGGHMPPPLVPPLPPPSPPPPPLLTPVYIYIIFWSIPDLASRSIYSILVYTSPIHRSTLDVFLTEADADACEVMVYVYTSIASTFENHLWWNL